MAAQETSKVCPKCFEVNDQRATFCSECGVPLTDEPGAEGSDPEVYREITEANLHRIRGNYKEAVDSCLGILRRYPNNGTSHTLLGDIYAENGELEKSAQWYEMALDLRPESEHDSRKLEAVQRRMAEQEAASTAKQLGIPESKPRTQQYVFVMAIMIAVVGVAGFLVGGYFSPAAAASPRLINEPIDVGGPAVEPAVNIPAPQSEDGPVEEPRDPEWLGTGPERGLMSALEAQPIGARILSASVDDWSHKVWLTARAIQGDDFDQIAVGFAEAVFSQPGYSSVMIRLTDGDSILYRAEVSRKNYQDTLEADLDAMEMLREVWHRDVSS